MNLRRLSKVVGKNIVRSLSSALGYHSGAMRMRRRGEPQGKEHVDEQADEGQLMTLPVGGHIGESQLDSGCT